MSSLLPIYLKNLNFTQHHLSTLESIGRHRGAQQLFLAQRPDEVELLRHTAIIASTISSNRLEGIIVEQSRLAELMQPHSRPKTRSEQEVAGYREVLELIHDSYEHMPVTASLLLQLHKLMYRYHPSPGGIYKMQDNTIIETDTANDHVRVRFMPTSALATPYAIDQLCQRYRQASQLPHMQGLVLAPLFVLDFLCIHPFQDGNGRMSRLMTLLLLYQLDYRVGRYISLERIIEQSKEGYYEALEHSSAGWHDASHDVLPWLEYFWGMLEAAYSEFEERVHHHIDARHTKSELVELAASTMDGPFQLKDLSAKLPQVSPALISKRLADLRAEGKLSLVGRGRAARWQWLNTAE